MTIVTLGLDLGKNWIHVVALDAEGRIVLRRRHIDYRRPKHARDTGSVCTI